MILGIDASNVRAGGGVSHLVNLLRFAEPRAHGIERIVVWGGQATLSQLAPRAEVELVHQSSLDRSIVHRLAWQRWRLPRLASSACDVLLVPGGNAVRPSLPVVTMSRNMLPFEWQELRRYGISYVTLRLLLLRWGQARTFERAEGIIFLTRYARDSILPRLKTQARVAIIPHGVESRFRVDPRPSRAIQACSDADPFRLLYVSIVDVYKHQDKVAEAVADLRASGLPVAVEFVGPAYPPALRRLHRTIAGLDPSASFLRYRGPVPYRQLHELYANAEALIFASSCENMPNTLLEAMAAGLPVACSSRGPMPEVLGDAGLLFDPEDAGSISGALRTLLEDPALRASLARRAHDRAAEFSWQRCATDTLAFVSGMRVGSTVRLGRGRVPRTRAD